MNKKTTISLLLCLVLCASLFAFPAFADGTVVIIGGAVEQNLASTGTYNSSGSSAVVVSGGSGGTVIVGSAGNAAAQSSSSAGTGITGLVIVMPNGQVQQIASQPVQTPQTQTVVQSQGTVQGQGIQISSAQAQNAAASSPVVVQEQNNTAQTVVTTPALDSLADELLKLINQKRAANGLSALSYSADLQASADIRAKESVQNFSHLRPDGRGCETAVTVDYTVTGENLIQVTSEFATAAIMMDTWMNSPTHRNNILLSSFTQMAVGIYVTNGTTYVSTVFVG